MVKEYSECAVRCAKCVGISPDLNFSEDIGLDAVDAAFRTQISRSVGFIKQCMAVRCLNTCASEAYEDTKIGRTIFRYCMDNSSEVK